MANRVLRNGNYKITYRFEQHTGFGKGTDVINKTTHSDKIIAHSDGTVINIVNDMLGKGKVLDKEGMGYGNYVAILHNDNVVTLYGHLKEVYVKVGTKVKKGTEIGFMGETGYANGVHLHFEVRKYRVTPTESNLNEVALFDFVDSAPYLDKDLPQNEYYKDELNAKSYPNYTEGGKGYQVNLKFNDWATSKGVYSLWQNAYNQWNKYKSEGYHVYDAYGKQLDTTTTTTVQSSSTTVTATKSKLTDKSYPDYTGLKYYYVQKKFKNWLQSKGVFRKWKGAFDTWNKHKDKGYHIFDNNGKQLD